MNPNGEPGGPDLRAVLFVPGDRPERFVKAVASGATAVTVDLEDAVAADRKAAARASAVAGLAALPDTGGVHLSVRINAVDSGLAREDLEALAPVLHRLDFVVLPMTSDAGSVRNAAGLLDRAEAAAGIEAAVALVPLVETAGGVLAAGEIAGAHPRVRTLYFGPADLSHHLGVTPTASGEELFVARSTVVLGAAAAGCAPPVDGPHLDLDDAEGLARSARTARRLGFGGKQVLHPRQVDVVLAAFAASSAELAWARAVDDAFSIAESEGVSAIRLPDGTFVDYPVAKRARTLLGRQAPR